MAAISSLVVNDVITSKDYAEEADTPTTPRAFRFPATSDIPPNIPPLPPTSMTQQPTQAVSTLPNQLLPQGNSPSTTHSLLQEEMTDVMDIDDSDPEGGDSDNDDETGDGDPASRKKKGQRFFCTGYPPCNLSFTRSEHLARHIRKHTGERPFQCHCNRRFSRLDNLRQHAQTVHVNEEIPTDSLAATGTRFQRQIRTERIRQNGRPRSGTVGSTGSHSRGHSRNLSASSVASTSSNYSTVTEAKRRPPPLLMANESNSRPKLGLDLPNTPPSQYRGFGPHSPGGMTTPTSATFSAAPGSPGYGSSIGSPAQNVIRGGYYAQSPRTPGRRLSVPSGPNPFQSQYSNIYPAPYSGQAGSAGPTNSSNSSLFSSPVSTSFSPSQSQHIPPSEDWRRRTWHPSTYTGPNFNYGRPATSSLTYSQTPDAPQPAYAQHATAAAGQAPRLPGIESFDHMQQRPSTPPRRQISPLRVDSRPPQLFAPNPSASRPSTYPELDEHGHVARSSSWSQQAINEIRKVGTNPQDVFRPMEMGPPAPAMNMAQQQHQRMAQEALQIQSTEKRNRRQGWYNGPPHGARTSPEDSSSSEGVPTPGTSSVEIHPIIMHSNGYSEPHHGLMPAEPQQNACLVHPNQMTAPYGNTMPRQRTVSFSERSTGSGDMNRLEALVAVATSSDSASMRTR